jgi:hypothetical protein
MKVVSLHLHGSECSKRTAWQTWSGFVMVGLDDGKELYVGDVSPKEALDRADAYGHDTADYRKRFQHWVDTGAFLVGPLPQ